MHIRNTLFWAALAAALPMSAHACGPDFPVELLRDRAWTLDKLPEGAFDYEAAHLVAPTSKVKAVEGGEGDVDGQTQSLRERIERGWGNTQDDAIARKGRGKLRVAPLRERCAVGVQHAAVLLHHALPRAAFWRFWRVSVQLQRDRCGRRGAGFGHAAGGHGFSPRNR